MKKNFIHHNEAFTLIEILISLSIFSLLVFAVSTIYIAFNNTQIRTAASQQLLNDSQYTIELMAREIRKSSIVNYSPDPAWCNSLIRPAAATTLFDDCIILEREDGQSFAFTTYRADSSSLYMDIFYILLDCTDDYSSCDDTWKNDAKAADKLLGTSFNGISVDSLDFIISPSSDPFVVGGVDQQPKVTIKMTTSYAAANVMENVSHNLQTTISSRVYRR